MIDIPSLLAGLGVGTLGGVYLDHILVRKRQIEQHQTERKEDQYKDLLENLPGFFTGTEDSQKQKKFMADLSSTALLFASSEVIRRGTKYVESVADKNTQAEERDKLANCLVIEIREEMKVDEDDPLRADEIKRYKLN
jgi:hypothetical protein